MKSGPNIVTDGLVFGYDTHDYSRFYNGPATTNHLLSLTQSWGNTIRTNGKAVAGTEEVNIPTIGKRTVKYVEYYNNYNNGDDLGCCPNLFNYHSGGTVPLVGNQSYTYSIVYKHTGGYTHPNFLYRYRYKADNTYIGEGGLHSTARRTHLGDGWYHAWGSWTTDSAANYGRFYSFLYNYGTDVAKFYVAAISLVKNNSGAAHLIIPPNLLLEPNTSISTTQSIIDLKKTNDIDVSNISVDSTGQPTLDGTDDEIDITFPTLNSDYGSIEVVVARKDTTTNSFIFGAVGASTNRYYLRHAGSTSYDACRGNPLANASFGVMTQDKFYHLVMTWDASTVYAYTNGVFSDSSSYTNPGTDITGGNIGQGSGNHVMADLPVFKIHNKVLSAEEVKQNYNAYKIRFDI